MSRKKELVRLIESAREAYYNGSDLDVTDSTFDGWVDELRALDPTSPAVLAIGAPVTNSPWEKARHGFVMGSLDKVNTPEEMRAWAGVPDRKLFVTEKLDGIACHLRFEYGKLVQAITRGDGTTGEDITRNVLRMKVLKEIPMPMRIAEM